MYIKMFKEQQVRVQDPLRPGRRIFETRLNPSGGSGLSHEGGKYEADEDGWIEVPEEVGQALTKFRGQKGEKFYTPDEVNEEVVAGRIKEDDGDALPQKQRQAAQVPPQTLKQAQSQPAAQAKAAGPAA